MRQNIKKCSINHKDKSSKRAKNYWVDISRLQIAIHGPIVFKTAYSALLRSSMVSKKCLNTAICQRMLHKLAQNLERYGGHIGTNQC